MKKKLWSLLSISGLSMLFVFSTSAYANESGDVIVEPDVEAINLSWEDTGDFYKLSKINGEEEEEVWRGEQNNYVVDNLNAGEAYQLKLETYDENDQLMDTAMINTPTLKDQEQVDSYNEELIDNSTNKEISYSMERSNISAVTYSDKVELNWSDIPTENNEYEILRDGEHLETVEGNEYVDDTIEQDEMYRYTVVGNKKLPQDRIDEIEMELEENDIQLSEEEKQQALYEPKETNVIINASEGDGESNSLSSDINQDDDWHLRYTSFIPMEYGENPWCTVSCTYDYFGGDDRGFGYGEDSFRTRSDAYVNSNLEEIQHNPQTGITIGYDEDLEEINRDQADAEADHSIYELSDDSSFAHIMNVSSINPLSPSPAIDAQYQSLINESGMAIFNGTHDQAPSHEFYLNNPDRTVYEIHTHEHQGFHHLLPIFPMQEFSTYIYN